MEYGKLYPDVVVGCPRRAPYSHKHPPAGKHNAYRVTRFKFRQFATE